MSLSLALASETCWMACALAPSPELAHSYWCPVLGRALSRRNPYYDMHMLYSCDVSCGEIHPAPRGLDEPWCDANKHVLCGRPPPMQSYDPGAPLQRPLRKETTHALNTAIFVDRGKRRRADWSGWPPPPVPLGSAARAWRRAPAANKIKSDRHRNHAQRPNTNTNVILHVHALKVLRPTRIK